MTEVRVVTPWRPDGGLRSALWAFCQSWWNARGVAPIESPSPDGPFNRAAAINEGLDSCDTWDVAVVIDADVVGCDHLGAAITLAERTGRMVFPYERYHGLAPWGMRHVLRGGELATAGTLRVVETHESSVVVIPRSVWNTTGGYDERFVGWGQDDVSYCQTVRVLTGEPLRVTGTVYHLWHEVAPEKDYDHPLWQANQALGRRYREATDPEGIQELLWERNALRSSRTSTPTTDGTVRTA